MMNLEESLAVKTDKKNGEHIRRVLQKKGVLRTDLKIKRNQDFLFIPIKSNRKRLDQFNVVKDFFQKTKQLPTRYQDVLSLPEKYNQFLPTSFDIIGDILLIKIPDEIKQYKKDIGLALLQTHTHVNTVCSTNPVSGELRTRSVEVIAGEHKTVTTHKEYGLHFRVDVKKTYFSPRLATERKRVSDLIGKNNCVFDMFCGVAPFSIMIATYAQPKQIIAIDKNPVATTLATQNSAKNKVAHKITVLNDDAYHSEKILSSYHFIPNHIIMNLPFSAIDFFSIAVKCVADNGMIHYYDIVEESNIIQRKNELKQLAEKENARIEKMIVHRIKTYAPHEFYIGIDITVSKNG